MRNWVSSLLVVLCIGGFQIWMLSTLEEKKDLVDPDLPDPSTGKIVATALHQAVSDPYFQPLENLADHLSKNDLAESIPVSLLSKWAQHISFPICFVWDVESEKLEIDQAVSPWVLEQLVSQLKYGLVRSNPQGKMQITNFDADGEVWWLGFQRVPYQSSFPTQLAGVVFSIDKYLLQDVPNFIDQMINRNRFPLVPFEIRNRANVLGDEGHVSIRILDDKDNVYLQRGNTFGKDHLIYAESQYYRRPVFAMQEGWDLQIFSSKWSHKQQNTIPFARKLLFVILPMLIVLGTQLIIYYLDKK